MDAEVNSAEQQGTYQSEDPDHQRVFFVCGVAGVSVLQGLDILLDFGILRVKGAGSCRPSVTVEMVQGFLLSVRRRGARLVYG
jgi:hypothetical protein